MLCSSAREYKTLLDARDRKIDVDVIHNMGFFQDPTNMIYKHCSEHHTAPSENLSVEPPSQQYSSFPVEYASSGSMPSNLMVMGELFSLRCYITTRMDAPDVATQQVKEELRYLSKSIGLYGFR
ncbi:hypothetical protein Lal_00032169 [Lupinus albus]|nr:hypothetical protein Lal_00032169 [Lupinus albus]